MEHTAAAQLAALLGAGGAALALLARGRVLPLAGFALLGLATAGLGRSLVGDDDLRLLVTEPFGVALVAVGVAAVCLAAAGLVRWWPVAPVALLAAAPFRVPVRLGEEEAFLLLPLYLVLAASVLALAYRLLRGEPVPAPHPALALPLVCLVAFAAASYLWTWDAREGAINLAFFVFPFAAGFACLSRAQLAPWLPRALLGTLAALGLLFAAIGLWQAQTRTVFFARDVEVANAYASFFRVTSLFKDPSLYGRYLVVPIVALLVVLLVRRVRPLEGVALTAAIAVLFAGLYVSYSQSSFVALFAATAALALLVGDRRTRVALAVFTLAATVAAAAVAAEAIEGRSAREATSGRSRLVSITVDAFRMRPLTGVGIGGQPRASAEAAGRR
ncbi:MAG TPA: O-antigen ligase family protein, partial [Gaiellaceae bacterium]|nr:O-antigen ligase family protein [Gaiellaceae bacterium]